MILVTGATGHIGNVLVRTLLAQQKSVRALVLPGEDLSPLAGLEVECIEGDILEPGSVFRALQGVQDVFHLAGVISIMPGRNRLVQQVNVQGTRNVLRMARLAGVRRLVYTSSIHALQRPPHGVVIDEAIPYDPEHAISAYDRSKAEASLLVEDAAVHGLDAVIACPTGVLGPHDYRGSEMGLVIRSAMRSGPQLCVDAAYDFVDVRDVASGLIQALEKGRTGESYILSGEQLSLTRLARLVQAALGRRAALLRLPISLARIGAWFGPWYYRLTHQTPRLTPYAVATVTSNSVISHAKASQELGYNARPLSETIRDTVHWLVERRSIRPNR